MLRWILAVLLPLTWVAPARAQLEAYSFDDTACAAAEPGDVRPGLVFVDGFEPPFAGSGTAGESNLSVVVPETATIRTVLMYAPPDYDPAQAWPLLLVLHGAPGSVAQAPAAAAAMRELWSPIAAREGFLVLALVADAGTQGGWVPSSDQPLASCALAEAARQFRVDPARRYVWGFSAGAHFAHALGLGNSTRFAAYAIKAGSLRALACPTETATGCATVMARQPRRIPAALRVGVDDAYLVQMQTEAGVFQSAGWTVGVDLEFAVVAGGHSLSGADLEASWSFLAGNSLSP